VKNRKKTKAKGGKNTTVPPQFSPGWLDKLDSRTAIARVMRERYAEVCNDLGGVGGLSYMQRSLVERGLWLEYWLASQERELADGRPFDVGKWVQAANSLQGIYSRLGLERRAREVPHLHDYIQGDAGE
jgi:hypothetical protein